MSESHTTVDDSLPHSVLERVDAICDRFEEAWLAGPRPRIEDYLDAVSDATLRDTLLQELIALDISHRRRLGETPLPGDYQRFTPLKTDLRANNLTTAIASPDRYQFGERIGVGGMGAVLRVRDVRLDRDLAIKVLREEHQGQAHFHKRFLEEARIGGRLQHPGIVPVHDLGELSDGRPFFSMKLVEGRTLASLLSERSETNQDMPRFLTIFEQICQTVAYAHAQCVIHRDLKPSNIMVGAFGEVQVMDWGLAKVLKRSSAEDAAALDETVAYTPDQEEDTAWQLRTRSGQVMGTYAYMPPEQARGEVERIDERSDVFGLGAILCETLTGRPPFSGGDGEHLAKQAREFDHALALARLDACGADAELRQVARACLAWEPEDRPRNASAVADAVKGYLAGVQERLRSSERERAAAQARAEEARKTVAAERRARRRMVWAALAVLLLVVGVGSGAWWAQRKQEQADQAVIKGLDNAETLEEQAEKAPLEPGKYQQALEVAQAADHLAVGGSDKVRARSKELVARLEREQAAAERDRRLVAALLEIRSPREGPRYMPDEKGEMMAMADRTMEEQFASAFREWGLDVDVVPAAEAVNRIKTRPVVVVTQVIAALDEWASQRRERKPEAAVPVAELAAALDDRPDSLSHELREILARGSLQVERALGELSVALRPVPLPVDVPLGKNRARLRQLAEKMDPSSEPVLGVLTLTRALLAAGENSLAEHLLRAALMARPREVVFYHTLAELLTEQKPPRWSEAVEFYRAARSLRSDLGVRLATALRHSSRVSEGLALLFQLVRDSPDNPYLHFQQAFALCEQGKYEEGAASYREAIALEPDYAEAYCNLGGALYRQEKYKETASVPELQPLGIAKASRNRQGKYKDAESAYRKAIELRPDLTVAYVNLGNILSNQGKPEEAEVVCRKAIALKPDLASAYNNLGNALVRQGRYAEAAIICRKAIDLSPDAPLAYNNLGNSLQGQGKYAEAEAVYRKAIPLKPDLVDTYNNLSSALNNEGKYVEAEAASRKAIALKPDYPLAHNNLAIALIGEGKAAEAEAVSRKDIALEPEFAESYNVLGSILAGQGKFAAAKAAYRKALALKPDHFMTYYKLGVALENERKNPEEAEDAYRKAIALKPDYAASHCNLGNILIGQGKITEAEASYRKAIALQPDLFRAHYNLGFALENQGKPVEAEKAYRKALALRPDFSEAYCNLGNVLQRQARFTESLLAFRRGHELGSKQSNWRYPSLRWVRTAERLIELDKKLPAIVQGNTSPANPGEAVTVAWMCRLKKLHCAAARLYADSFAADPNLTANFQRHRHEAACSAALAASRQGKDAHLLPDKAAAMFRRWALGWLGDDLAAYDRLAEQSTPAAKRIIQQRLAHWQDNPELAGLRDREAVDKLPQGEREACQMLWEDVAALLKRAQEQ